MGSGPRAPEAGNPYDVFRGHQGTAHCPLPRALVVMGDREVVRDGSVPKSTLSKQAVCLHFEQTNKRDLGFNRTTDLCVEDRQAEVRPGRLVKRLCSNPGEGDMLVAKAY